MAAYEVLLLNTAIPQIQAAQAGDTYVVPRDISFSAKALIGYTDYSGVGTNGLAVAGNVGVGTSSPANKLSINQGSSPTAGLLISGTSSPQLVITETSTPVTAQYATDTAAAYLGTTTNHSLILRTNTTERARISSDGTFRVKGAGTAGSTDAVQFSGSAPASAMTLDASGNLVVGATSTSYRMEVVAPSGDYITALFRSGDATAANNAGGGFRNVSSATAASRYTQIWLDADGANFGGGDYFYIQKNGNSGTVDFVQYSNAAMTFATNNTERARITSGGLVQVSSGGSVQVGGTAARATTAGTNRVDIFNGTAPVGTLANGISLYSSAGEAYVMDAAGNATLFSPHDAETNEWIFKSKHTPSGKVLKIDVEKMLRFINDHFGLDAIHEFTEEA